MNAHSFPLAQAALLDTLVGGSIWLMGFAAAWVSVSALGLAWWLAAHREPTGVAPVVGRAALGLAGLLILALGLSMLAAGTEALLGYPLGPGSSGGGSMFAFWLTSEAAVFDAALTLALFSRLHARTEEDAHHALKWAAGLALGLTWGLSKLLAFLAFMVAADVFLW